MSVLFFIRLVFILNLKSGLSGVKTIWNFETVFSLLYFSIHSSLEAKSNDKVFVVSLASTLKSRLYISRLRSVQNSSVRVPSFCFVTKYDSPILNFTLLTLGFLKSSFLYLTILEANVVFALSKSRNGIRSFKSCFLYSTVNLPSLSVIRIDATTPNLFNPYSLNIGWGIGLILVSEENTEICFVLYSLLKVQFGILFLNSIANVSKADSAFICKMQAIDFSRSSTCLNFFSITKSRPLNTSSSFN